MANAARLAIAARRNEVARFTIAVTGIDLTGVAMAMQVRLRADTPGAPLIELATVMTAAAEGLKLDSVNIAGGVPTSIIKGRINASTMTDAAKVPYTGEVGDNSCLAYAMQWTLGGDAQTRLYGDFIVVASAFGSDAAPTNRPVGYGGARQAAVGETGTLTFGDQIINVTLNDADILMPFAQSAAASAAAAQGYAATATAAGITLLTGITSAPNEIDAGTVPGGAFVDGRYYRLTSPITSTGAFTLNERPVLGPDGAPITAPGAIQAGGDLIVRFKLSNSTFLLVVAATTRLDTMESLTAALQAGATTATANIAANAAAVRVANDPYVNLAQKIMRGAFGTVTYANGVRSVVAPTLIIASIGNSHMVAQGAASLALAPGEQLGAAFQALLPGWTVVHDSYGVPGSWTSQMGGQIDGFTRKPDIVLIGDPMNDGTANIFMGYEGFVGPNNTYGGYEAALANVFAAVVDLGDCVPVNLSGHQPHPSRSKANNRFQVTPEVLMAFPVASLVVYFVTLTYTASNQRITSNVPGIFNQYGNGLLAVGSHLLDVDESAGEAGQEHQVVEIDAAGTWVRVNGTIAANKTTVGNLRQCRFDNETQVWPPLSQAIVQRDYSGTGTPVDVSWRHWELAKANRRVAARNGVVTIDTDTMFGRQVLSNADYNTLFPNNDDYHSAAWYTMLAEPFARFARDVVNGTIPAGRIYS